MCYNVIYCNHRGDPGGYQLNFALLIIDVEELVTQMILSGDQMGVNIGPIYMLLKMSPSSVLWKKQYKPLCCKLF